MPWKRTATLQMMDPAFEARVESGVIVFRGAQSVFGWRKDAAELAWLHTMPDELLFGVKRLFPAPGTVVTLRQTRPGRTKYLVWLEPTTGRLKQEHAYSFEPSQDGFTAAGDFLFLHGNLPDGSGRLLRIASDTGDILEKVDAPLGRQLLASPRRLYLHEGSNGLSHTPVETTQWTHVGLGPLSEVTPWGRQLFFFQIPEDKKAGWELVWWDADEARPIGRMGTAATTGLVIRPSPREGVVAAYQMEQGLWLLDLSAEVSRWNLPLEAGDKLKAVCWTPHGLVTAIWRKGAAATLELRDAASGEIREALPSTLIGTSDLFWLEDRLIASGIDGLESFAWEG